MVVSFLVDEMVGGFFISVPPGHVACVYDRWRGVLPKVYGPGLRLKIPFWQIAKLFNAQTLEYTIQKGFDVETRKEELGDEPIRAITSDNKAVVIEGTILLRINKDRVTELWERIGENFVSKIIRPISRSRIRAVIAEFTADEVISTKRSTVEATLRQALQDAAKESTIIVENVLLSEVKLSDEPYNSNA